MELSCSCPEKCRGYLRPDDFDHFYAVWDEQLRAALQQALSVAQPLWGLLSDETAATVTRYIKTGEGYKSVLALKMVTGDR
jgi:hypothetical protein